MRFGELADRGRLVAEGLVKDLLRMRPAAWRALFLVLVLVPFLVPLYRQFWIRNHEGYSYAIRVIEVLRCWHDGFPSARGVAA